MAARVALLLLTEDGLAVAPHAGNRAHEPAGVVLDPLVHTLLELHRDERSVDLARSELGDLSLIVLRAGSRLADEPRRTVEAVCASLLHDSDLRGVVVTMRDVTERKQLEEALSPRAGSPCSTSRSPRRRDWSPAA